MPAQQILLSYSGPVVNFTGTTLSSTLGRSAGVQFNINGSVSYDQEGVITTLTNEWLNPNPDSANAALYEIQRTQVSGAIGVTFTGTFTSGTWYPLSVQRGVSVAADTLTRTNNSTYAIRRASDLVVLVTGITVSLTSAP